MSILRTTAVCVVVILAACTMTPPKPEPALVVVPMSAQVSGHIEMRAVMPAAFQADCTLPFASPGEEIDFDESCGNAGTPDANDEDQEAARGAEYQAKNNLCANGDVVDLKFPDFKKLQQDLAGMDLPIGNDQKSIPHRSVLTNQELSGSRNVGEGQVVRLVGFADVKSRGSKEGVNCGETQERKTDIHINVSPHSGVECDGIVAEIIPHRRPAGWSHTEAVNRLQDSVIRVTGQLFLDSRHRVEPRTANDCPAPKRMSLWEIHPIYALDICRLSTLAACKANDDSVWTPF